MRPSARQHLSDYAHGLCVPRGDLAVARQLGHVVVPGKGRRRQRNERERTQENEHDGLACCLLSSGWACRLEISWLAL